MPVVQHFNMEPEEFAPAGFDDLERRVEELERHYGVHRYQAGTASTVGNDNTFAGSWWASPLSVTLHAKSIEQIVLMYYRIDLRQDTPGTSYGIEIGLYEANEFPATSKLAEFRNLGSWTTVGPLGTHPFVGWAAVPVWNTVPADKTYNLRFRTNGGGNGHFGTSQFWCHIL